MTSRSARERILARGLLASALLSASAAASVSIAPAQHVASSGQRYDPLRLDGEAADAETIDLVAHDAERQRDIPLLVYLPRRETASGATVLFSHGLGGSRTGSAFLGRHWSARGYLAVYLQHPGSDAAVWEDVPLLRRMAALRRSANAENWLARALDVPAVLDRLEEWNRTEGHPLAGLIEVARVGMSGHSFGAITTQAVSGQVIGRGRRSFTDPRIAAAIAFSPSTPSGGDAERAFGSVAIPWMLMTGTEDVSAIGNADMASRLAVFPALPPGGKYELVLHEAEHSVFTDRPLPGDQRPRNPAHHRAIVALSTAFWDGWLLGDAAARAWLDGPGARSVLDRRDRWQRK